MSELENTDSRRERLHGWTSTLARVSTAGLLILGLGGMGIWLLPFSLANQISVILHTILGVLLTGPILVYCWRHWRRYADFPLTHVKLLRYLTVAVLIACLASGAVLTCQAVLSTRIDYGWRDIHRWSTVLLAAFSIPHVLLLAWRHLASRDVSPESARAVRGYFLRSSTRTVLLATPLIAFVVLYTPFQGISRFPDDYELWQNRPLSRESTLRAEPRPHGRQPSGGRAPARRIFELRHERMSRADRPGMEAVGPSLQRHGLPLPGDPADDGPAERRHVHEVLPRVP